MKRNLIFILLTFFSLSLIGCSDTEASTKNKPKNKIESVEVASPPYSTPFIVTNETTSSNPFIFKDDNLIFPNYDDKDRISIIEGTLPSQYIKTEDVSNFYDYRTSTVALLNDTLYFSDYSDGYCLSSYNMSTNTYTKLLNIKVDNLTIYKDILYFINKDDGYKLYSYDITNKESHKLTDYKVGKYIINGNNILYQNIDKNSRLYRISLTGADNSQLTDFATDSFVVHNGIILVINSHDDYTLYSLTPSGLNTKRISLLKMKDLKSYGDNIYFLDRDTSNLHSLTYDVEKEEVTTNTIFDEGVNDYYPTEKAVFIKKAVNINNNYIHIVTVNNQ